MIDEKYVDEKAREAHKRFAFSHYDSHGTWIKEMKDFIRTIREDCKPKVSREFIGKVTARIYCDRKSVRAIKENVREAFEEAGVEVEE